MRFAATKTGLICSVAFLALVGIADRAHAQFGAGTTWLRTDAQGKGITMTVESCCNGGFRLTYHVPPMGGQPPSMMTADSPMDGTEVPVLVGGKASGETMAIKRVDDRHYSTVIKMNGQAFGTCNSTVSADGKTMTVEGVYQTQKIIETWVRK